jgi:hydrogenase maturation protein HypF
VVHHHHPTIGGQAMARGTTPTDVGDVRLQVRVTGIVQGVGFRPYVHRLAVALGLAGFVGNDAQGVVAEIEGAPAAIEAFLSRLPDEAPAMSVIEDVTTSPIEPSGDATFEIVVSEAEGARDVPVSPDIATCADCLAELWDPDDRRFRFPFINCTNCGPRYTIVRDVPYDRPTTTMAGFAMCDACAREYTDPADRRFHAQPVCCPRCGPTLALVDAAGVALDGDPVTRTAALLRDGRVVAVKGLGGYHLAVDATDEAAVRRLRARKHREERPLAVMVADLAVARALCEIGPHEQVRLTAPTAPIVLLRRRDEASAGVALDDRDTTGDARPSIASSVAPGNRHLGVMLPYTPLHHLLAAAMGRPFVLTSGNVSDEPIAYDDTDARDRLGGIADAFLTHDRPIHMRVDDSVVRMVGDRPLLVRRSRGYAPQPVLMGRRVPRPVLAVGAELKNTVCLAKARRAYLSHHIGDLENYETFRSFTGAIAHLRRLFDIAPSVVAHDLHPEYLSTKHALDLDGLDRVAVQHHHAHIASCMADNGTSDPVIGVAFDGTGFGTDGTIWGGEVLVATLGSFERVGHLGPTPLPGGAAAIREPWRMAASWLRRTYGHDVPDHLGVVARHADRWAQVLAVADANVNSPPTSSVGRLFDAVAALVGVRDTVSYEGQAAIELEQAADPTVDDGYRAALSDGEPFVIDGAGLIRAVVDDLIAGTPVPVIAGRFHVAVVRAIVDACTRVHAATGLSTVALSGGVFQNVLLVERSVAALEAAGFVVLTHVRVPPNDGGISFGQVAVAAARDRDATA